ncbi:unnamed protein product [Timema podura]|uniref:Uncharacterized protein n=1 Tax=Timema podura TaxID=61482 RepID=A0ABN7PSZ7_TIMPD|nr:unnamed protein product [Timema podura]
MLGTAFEPVSLMLMKTLKINKFPFRRWTCLRANVIHLPVRRLYPPRKNKCE